MRTKSRWLVSASAAAVAAASMAATTSVQSSNVVGYDNSLTGGPANTFAGASFVAVGYNTADIQSIQIPGAEWDDVLFSIWEGVPTVRANSEFTYTDASNDPSGEMETAYWCDSDYNPVSYSIAPGQGFVLYGADGYEITISKPYSL